MKSDPKNAKLLKCNKSTLIIYYLINKGSTNWRTSIIVYVSSFLEIVTIVFAECQSLDLTMLIAVSSSALT